MIFWPWLTCQIQLSTASIFDKEEDDKTIINHQNHHVDVLKRNLAAFDLEIEAVIGDGDYAFRILAKQIARLSGENGSFFKKNIYKA